MFGKKNTTEPVVRRVSRRREEEPDTLNRKLIFITLLITGVISMSLWYKGHRQEEGEIKIISPVIKVTPTSKEAGINKKRQLLVDKMQTIVATASGTYAVYVYELDKQSGFGFNEQVTMPGASILKVPVMMTALEEVQNGTLTLEQTFDLREGDRSPGSGPMQFMKAGTVLPLDKILEYLGRNSDNTAWLLLNRVLGTDAIEQTMETIGMDGSSYKNRDVTAGDVTKMFTAIYQGKIIGDAGREQAYKYLSESIYEDRIAKGVPLTEVQLIHKVGTLDNVWIDAGIVRCKLAGCGVAPYVVTILNKEVLLSEAKELVPSLARKVWEYEKSL